MRFIEREDVFDEEGFGGKTGPVSDRNRPILNVK